MSESTPDRLTVSIPADAVGGLEELDELVEKSEYESRSAFVRQAIFGEAE